MASAEDRFWAKVDRRGPDECWPWTAATHDGYGTFYDSDYSSRNVRAHRWAYQNLVGPIPDGLVIDHLCRNRACCNPAHMEPVTDRENILRGEGRGAKQARQTHCKRGHPLEGDNLYHRPDGSRQCRACLKLAEQRRTERNANRQNWKERALAAEAQVEALTQERDDAFGQLEHWKSANLYPLTYREAVERAEAAEAALAAVDDALAAAGITYEDRAEAVRRLNMIREQWMQWQKRDEAKLATTRQALAETLDIIVERWHEWEDDTRTLAEFMEMTDDEYAGFAKNGPNGYADAIARRALAATEGQA